MKTYTVTLQTGPYTFETVTVQAENIQQAWDIAVKLCVKGMVTAVNTKWY